MPDPLHPCGECAGRVNTLRAHRSNLTYSDPSAQRGHRNMHFGGRSRANSNSIWAKAVCWLFGQQRDSFKSHYEEELCILVGRTIQTYRP